jgi:hypothetical protein
MKMNTKCNEMHAPPIPVSMFLSDPVLFETVPTPFGRNFVIEGALTTADGRAPKVRAVWFIANRQEIATLATAYPLDA